MLEGCRGALGDRASGRMEAARAPLESLGVDFDQDVIVTRDQVR